MPSERPTPLSPAAARPGRRVCIAVVDSGVHAAHPHVRGVAGGIAIDAGGRVSSDYADRMGHGTAVMAAIKEKAPAADCYAVRIFDARLSASASTLLAAIDWAVEARVHIINLSLGTATSSHAAAFREAVERARAAGVAIVAPRDDEGVEWLPGCLPGVIPVQVDWECPRDQYRVVEVGGTAVFRASGFARPIPGVDPRRNLHGVSFAVAHVTGFLARAMSNVGAAPRIGDALALLEGRSDRGEGGRTKQFRLLAPGFRRWAAGDWRWACQVWCQLPNADR